MESGITVRRGFVELLHGKDVLVESVLRIFFQDLDYKFKVIAGTLALERLVTHQLRVGHRVCPLVNHFGTVMFFIHPDFLFRFFNFRF